MKPQHTYVLPLGRTSLRSGLLTRECIFRRDDVFAFSNGDQRHSSLALDVNSRVARRADGVLESMLRWIAEPFPPPIVAKGLSEMKDVDYVVSFPGALVFAGGVIRLRDFSFAYDPSTNQTTVLLIALTNLVDR